MNEYFFYCTVNVRFSHITEIAYYRVNLWKHRCMDNTSALATGYVAKSKMKQDKIMHYLKNLNVLSFDFKIGIDCTSGSKTAH